MTAFPIHHGGDGALGALSVNPRQYWVIGHSKAANKSAKRHGGRLRMKFKTANAPQGRQQERHVAVLQNNQYTQGVG
jgi:hypothetical protein